MTKKEKELIITFDSLLHQIRRLSDEIGDGEVVDILTDHIKADAANKEPASSLVPAYELSLPAHELKRLCLSSVLTQSNDDSIFLLLDFIQSALKVIKDFEAGRVPCDYLLGKVKEVGSDQLETVIFELMNRTSDYRREIEKLSTYNPHI